MTTESGSSEYGRAYWVSVVIGGAVMAFAVRGALVDLPLSSFGSWGKWLIGLDLVNDFVILPVVALIGLGLARLPLGRGRAPVQAGLFASAIVIVIVWPCLLGLSASGNPTIQPLDYTTATLTVLAVVWALVGAWAMIRQLDRRSRPEAVQDVGG